MNAAPLNLNPNLFLNLRLGATDRRQDAVCSFRLKAESLSRNCQPRSLPPGKTPTLRTRQDSICAFGASLRSPTDLRRGISRVKGLLNTFLKAVTSAFTPTWEALPA